MSAAAWKQEGPRPLSIGEVARLNRRFEGASPQDLLSWALDTFADRLVIASSFSAEDIVLIDLAASVDPDVRVFTLDTGRLHQETYDTMEATRKRYGLNLEVLYPKREALETLTRENGLNSFYESVERRKECCQVRKVEPLRRVLATADAWVTGMRREQSVTRHSVSKVEIDMMNGGLLKLNPLADFDRDAVWSYIRDKGLPHNPLHDEGFASIGCAPCTRAIQPGEDERAGRWWWERPDDKECGLHAK